MTSDKAYLDEDQFLVFCGRADDVINLNGELVHPDEIESHLIELFPRNAYVVVGMKDPDGVKDMVAVLVVEGETEVTTRDLARHMTDKDRNLMPNLITAMERLPRTRSGKVQRSVIVRELTASLLGTSD